MKLFYVGRLPATHVCVGKAKYHFSAEDDFAADVSEDHAKVLLRTGQYMPGGTDAARKAVARARRIAGDKAAPSDGGKSDSSGDATKPEGKGKTKGKAGGK